MSVEEKKPGSASGTSNVLRNGSNDVAEAPKLMRATVERGRSVIANHPTKKKIVAWTDQGKPVEHPIRLHYGPGQEVELPPDEVKFLRERGYLVDPNRKAPVSATDNPMVTTVEQRNRELSAEQLRGMR